MTVHGFGSKMFLRMCIFNSHNICIFKLLKVLFLVFAERCLLFRKYQTEVVLFWLVLHPHAALVHVNRAIL